MLREGGGYSGFQVTGVMVGLLGGGVTFSIFSGFFWVGKFWHVFFGYSKLIFPFFLLYHLVLSGTFYDWVFGMEFFGG